MTRFRIAALSFAALLAACSPLAPRDMGQSYLFSLQPAPVARQELIGDTIVVAMPRAAPELDTTRVALLKTGRAWDYYEGLRWASFLPELVQEDLVKTLGGSGLYLAVAGDTSGLHGDRRLVVSLHDFQAEYASAGAPPLVRLSLVARIEGRLDHRVIQSFTLAAQRRAAADTAPAINAAFQAGFDDVLRQLVERLSEHP